MYREELTISIFANLASIPLFKDTLLKLLGQALTSVQPGVSTFQLAEVVLYLLYNLQSTIPGQLRDQVSEENPYCQLMQYLLKVDFISFNHRAVNLMYMEVLARYLPYFIKITGFTQQVFSLYFSDKGLRSQNSLMANKTSYLFVRTCERLVNSGLSAEERSVFPSAMKHILDILHQYYTGQPSKLSLNREDILNLYQALGHFMSSQNVEIEARKQVLIAVYDDLML